MKKFGKKKFLFVIVCFVTCGSLVDTIAATTTATESATAGETRVEPATDASDSIASTGSDFRSGRDLVYESMKMRSGNWKPRSPDDEVSSRCS
jgi:hypothetical protein